MRVISPGRPGGLNSTVIVNEKPSPHGAVGTPIAEADLKLLDELAPGSPFAKIGISLAAIPIVEANDRSVGDCAALEETADRVDRRLIQVAVEVDEAEFLLRSK